MATDCKSECDCGAPGGYPHEPDCHSYDVCDEGRWCDKHHAEAMEEHEYLRDIPRYAVFLNDPEAREEFNQELRDAGRGHLVEGALADRIDMARMRAKDAHLADDLHDIAIISDERRNS